MVGLDLPMRGANGRDRKRQEVCIPALVWLSGERGDALPPALHGLEGHGLVQGREANQGVHDPAEDAHVAE